MAVEKMSVVDIPDPGGPEALRFTRRPVPEPGPGEVLLRVIAAGVNGPDLLQRKGAYPPPPGASDLPGLEVAGEVVAPGAEANRWAAGDRVVALTNGGGYAEYVAVPEGQCLPVPQGLDPVDAAGLPETYFTVWSNVFFGHAVPEGARMLVQGGAGGIGATAVALGAAFGLEVFATAGSAEALAFVESLGAARAIDYRSEDYVAVLKEAGGADIVVDILGGSHIARHLKACGMDGRIVQLSFRQGSKVEIDLMPVMLKRLTLMGSTLRPRPPAFKAAVARDLEAKVWPLFADGRLRAVTHKALPLSEAAEAHRMLEAGGHRGKVILRV
ncbi:MAG: NAD(P)H-quinone oxidoreductase [Paracoccaceae bacterium]|nr:NAD(P)H-quinone oxidoreductase [Paracoccaceae bacterium]